eukprot:4693119-Pleurochrysis_carterae.AAC.1
MVQRAKKTNEPLTAKDGTLLPLTSHTLAPVPVFIGGKGLPDDVVFRDDLPDAGLANVTATIFNLMGYEAPAEYEPSLLKVSSGGAATQTARAYLDEHKIESVLSDVMQECVDKRPARPFAFISSLLTKYDEAK